MSSGDHAEKIIYIVQILVSICLCKCPLTEFRFIQQAFMHAQYGVVLRDITK